MSKTRVVVAGSERKPIPNSRAISGASERPDPNEQLQVTLILRTRAEIPVQVRDSGTLTKEKLEEEYGTTPEDMAAVTRFAQEYGLKVVEENKMLGFMKLYGPIDKMEKAFGVSLKHVSADQKVYRERTGHITVDAEVGDIIRGVHGLDNRPQARPRFRLAAAAATSYSPLDLAQLYNFPAGDGEGQTIAIIELGGGYTTTDLSVYFNGLGIVTTPDVSAVGVDGAGNSPTGDPGGPDGEVMLDIEVAGAIAPKAEIIVYFAPNTDNGFLDAINAAVGAKQTPTVVSISWGKPEDEWTEQSLTNFDKAFQTGTGLKINFIIASGDNGSSDLDGYDNTADYQQDTKVRYTDKNIYLCIQATTAGTAPGNNAYWQLVNPYPLLVNFPGSSPNVLSCGGTSLTGTGTISQETVWNSVGGDGYTHGSGGGVSGFFSKPAYQSGVNAPPPPGGKGGRGVPDISGNADTNTGYQVRIDGGNYVFGGTSAVAPLWAGLIARLAQITGNPPTFLNNTLYANPAAMRDITQGTNDMGGAGGQYTAGPGWDACTGLGSPKGAAILSLLKASTASARSRQLMSLLPKTPPPGGSPDAQAIVSIMTLASDVATAAIKAITDMACK